MFKLVLISLIGILLTQNGFNKINNTDISNIKSQVYMVKKIDLPNCNEVDEKINCYYDLNNLNDIEVEILLYQDRCKMNQETFEKYINFLFENFNSTRLLVDSLFVNDIDTLSSYQYFLNIGCYDYKKVLYAKNKYERQVKDEIVKKSYPYQVVFYLLIGILNNVNFITNLVTKLSSIAILMLTDYIVNLFN